VKLRYIMTIFCLFNASVVFALGRGFYLPYIGLASLHGFHNPFIPILLGFFIELFIMFKLVADSSPLKIVLATLSMNVVSATLGSFLTALVELLSDYITFTVLQLQWPWTAYIMSASFFVITVLMNVFIETPIACIFFKKINIKKLMKLLLLANTISTLIIVIPVVYRVMTQNSF